MKQTLRTILLADANEDLSVLLNNRDSELTAQFVRRYDRQLQNTFYGNPQLDVVMPPMPSAV